MGGDPDGPLAQYSGPDVWQSEFLERLGEAVRTRGFNGKIPVAPIRMATSSGHGIGKSTLVAWIVNWIMSTRENSRGTITANTFTQVKDKTWASIRKWTPMCLMGHWFTITSERMSHTTYPATWFCAAQSCREENSEAFAGQHAADSTSFYVFDEASAVPDTIYEVAEGGLTDGEPMMFLFGNPTRSTGKFHHACVGSARNRWNARTIDSRTCAFTNKAQIAEWAEDYGEDSDFFRVRVRGLPPQASELQFIANDLVFAAQTREATALKTDPVTCGLDIARGGADHNVFRFRRGADGRSIAAIRIPGEHTRDSMVLVAKAADLLENGIDDQPIAAMFVDGTGIGGPIVDRLKQLGFDQVVEIQFGWKAPDLKYANMRAYMWGRLRDWLAHGAIDDTPTLEQDLTGPGYTHNSRDQLLLESKEHMKRRALSSPDDGDALALTFSAQVASVEAENDSSDWAASLGREGRMGWMY